MNFVRYDPNTGAITSQGYAPEEAIQAEMDEGKPTLKAANIPLVWGKYHVNLKTMQIEPIPVEETP